MSRTDHRSTEAQQYRKLYRTARWAKLREAKLAADPLCARCLEMEVVEPATVVHHRRAHKGSETLFWDYDNLESICKPHHDSHGQLEDHGKTVVRFDAAGWPL